MKVRKHMSAVLVRDLWKFKNKSNVYGYCSCGREVRQGKDNVCPMCDSKLIWSVAKKIKEI